MIKKDAFPDFGSWVDINCKDIRDARLKCERQRLSGLGPELVSHSVSLASEKSLIIKKAVREGDACGVTKLGGAKVGDSGGAEGGVVGEDIEK